MALRKNENAKELRFDLRMNSHTAEMLAKLQRRFDLKKSEIVRQAIEVVYLHEFKGIKP